MAKTITIDPLTRIEGHLAVKIDVENKKVKKAYTSGEMFRGFEIILKNRHPMDAQQITQRICGVCPISHGMASILAQDMAYGVKPPKNGRLLRNLILGANYIQSHIVHFYHLAALDYVDVTAVAGYNGNDPGLKSVKNWVNTEIASKSPFPAAPLLPRYSGNYVTNNSLNIAGVKHYLEGLEMRALAHECAAIFAGKMPHAITLVPGGVSERVTAENIARFSSKLKTLITFINDCYIPDVLAVAKGFPEYFSVGKGCGNFLSYGVFHESDDSNKKLLPPGVILNGEFQTFHPDNITEDVGYSMFSSESGLKPHKGNTIPAPGKKSAYSWLKAPRYNGNVMEVGPLARVLVAYHSGDKKVIKLVDATLRKLNAGAGSLVSVLGRHAARALEAKLVAEKCDEWLAQLTPGNSTCSDFEIPESGSGYGLTEAPRGAIGHWLSIENKKVAGYQCVVPTTWNCSPRDDKGKPGTVEQALVGTPIASRENPIEATRVVRSFDPCIACAVH